MRIDLKEDDSARRVVKSAMRKLNAIQIFRILWKIYLVRGGSRYQFSLISPFSKSEIKRMLSGDKEIELGMVVRLSSEIFSQSDEDAEIVHRIFQFYRVQCQPSVFLDAPA